MPEIKPSCGIRFDPVDLIRRRLKRNQNALIAVTGQTGSGKSMVSLKLAECIDPDFQADQVVFKVSTFIDRMEEMKPGQVLVFDEAGVDFDARRSGSKANVGFSNILKTFRYKQLPTIFTLPRLTMLDVNGRRLFHYWLKTSGIDYTNNLCKTHWFCIDSEDDWSDKVKRYFPRVIDRHTGERAVISWVKWPMPSKKIVTEYEKLKDEFVVQMNDEIRRKLLKLERDDDPDAPKENARGGGARPKDLQLTKDDLEMLETVGKMPPKKRAVQTARNAVDDPFMSEFEDV